jgi:NagD protein
MNNYLIDMDGVLISGQSPIPGAAEFIERLHSKGIKFLVLTNNSAYTPMDLAHRLQRMGINIDKSEIFTSAMATARFLQTQKPHGEAYLVGETGLMVAMHEIGYIQTDINPDFVVLGETSNYNFESITKAVRLVAAGARFIATNPDATGPTDRGIEPACGAMAALIQTATNRAPFFIGKPNPFMMRAALNYLGVHSEDTFMIGDRMDTDMIAGIQTGLGTCLVLTGVTSRDMLDRFPYRPQQIYGSVAEMEL